MKRRICQPLFEKNIGVSQKNEFWRTTGTGAKDVELLGTKEAKVIKNLFVNKKFTNKFKKTLDKMKEKWYILYCN